jgi:hypothetical protein
MNVLALYLDSFQQSIRPFVARVLGEEFAGEGASQERRRDMADVAHRKLGVTLGQGQKLIQWCWLALRHNSDSAGSAMPEQAARRR